MTGPLNCLCATEIAGTNTADEQMKPRHTEITPQSRPTPSPQHQELPGEEVRMVPKPMDDDPRYRGSGKLLDKVALISGGDSGIGRATAIFLRKKARMSRLFTCPRMR